MNGTPSKTFNLGKFEDEEQEPLTDQHKYSGATGKLKSPGNKAFLISQVLSDFYVD